MICSLTLSILSTFTVHCTADSSISKTINLKEVVISSDNHKVEEKDGKIVYNAYMEKVRTDVSAADLLRKVPMMSVDVNGNVSIRGNSNVKILVNGHDMGMLSTSLLLQQIPSSNILKVEVMSNPGVKYGSQGTGGVLNIITIKRMHLKSSGYINAGVGTKGSHLMGNFNSALSKAWSMQNTFYSLIGYSKNTSSTNYSVSSEGNNIGQLYSYMGGVSRNRNKSLFNIVWQYLYQGTSYKESSQDMKRLTTTEGYHYISTAANYNLTFDEKQKIDFQTRFFLLPTKSIMHREAFPLYKSGSTIFGQASQLDFSLRPLRQLYVECGASNKYSSFHNRYYNNTIRSINNFGIYTELKYVATPFFSFTSGIRYENYYLDTPLSRKKQYNDLFYNVGVGYKLTPFNTVSLTFSRRTDRPTYENLLQDANYQGGDVMQQGNYYINPSYSYMLEGGWSLYAGKLFLKVAPFYSYVNAPLSLLVNMKNDMMQQTSTNLDGARSLGMEIWSTMTLFQEKLNFNGGINIKHIRLETNNLSNRGWHFSYTMNATWRLSPSLYINCYGTWKNKTILLQGTQNSYLYSNISIQKSWNADQFRVALSMDNPFSNGITVRRKYNIMGTTYYSQTKYHNTGVRLFFIYKFGNKDMEKNIKIRQDILNNN